MGGAVAPRSGALDLHEELCDPRAGNGCLRWPEGHWLLSSLGQLVPGRCGATNKCAYCARLTAVENTEMLALDALEGDAPQVWAVLTTRTATVDMARFYRSRARVLKAVRSRWPSAEYACLLEFTTGYGPRASGQRRPHWNLILKGVPVEDLDQAREVIIRIWCSREDALPAGQHVGAIAAAEGLMRYLALHFQKESQAPPAGFSGQRFNCSRGYFTGRSRAEMRELARESLWRKRRLREALKAGLEGAAAEAYVEDALAEKAATDWRLYVQPVKRSEPVEKPAPIGDELLLAAFVDLFNADVERFNAGPSTPPALHGGAPPGRGPSEQTWPGL